MPNHPNQDTFECEIGSYRLSYKGNRGKSGLSQSYQDYSHPTNPGTSRTAPGEGARFLNTEVWGWGLPLKVVSIKSSCLPFHSAPENFWGKKNDRFRSKGEKLYLLVNTQTNLSLDHYPGGDFFFSLCLLILQQFHMQEATQSKKTEEKLMFYAPLMHNDSDSGLMLFTGHGGIPGFPVHWGMDVKLVRKQQFCLSRCDIVYTKHSSGAQCSWNKGKKDHWQTQQSF